jgi:hypothetical protein
MLEINMQIDCFGSLYSMINHNYNFLQGLYERVEEKKTSLKVFTSFHSAHDI